MNKVIMIGLFALVIPLVIASALTTTSEFFLGTSTQNLLNTPTVDPIVTRLNQTWLDFDGDNDYILISPSITFFNSSNNFAIVGNVLIKSNTTIQTIFATTSGTLNRFSLQINSGQIRTGIYNGTDFYGSSSTDINKLDKNKWYYFIYTYNSTEGLLYLDDIYQSGTNAGQTSGIISTYIGRRQDNTQYLNG